MPSHVDVTLEHAGGRLDLRVPTRVAVHRLVDELAAIVPGLGTGLGRYQLRVRGTALLLTEEDDLGSGPVVTGDVLVLDDERSAL